MPPALIPERNARNGGGRSYPGLGLALSNLLTIGLALWQDWDLGPLLCIYWFQSVVIGFFNFLRMRMLKDFTTEGLSSDGVPIPETEKGKRSTANFFLFHYGFFHLIYLFFIGGQITSIPANDWMWVSAGALGFLVSHAISFRQSHRLDLVSRPNLGTMMFLPYARILPMHLTIIFGGNTIGTRNTLVFFLVLKSAADQLMHFVEQHMMRKAQARAKRSRGAQR